MDLKSSSRSKVPNSFFQFKKFRIDQSRCAMKVSTEACLFGALVDIGTAKTILDIGAGTGLLSLMMAQRSDAKIDAVEIDDSAYQQCIDNFQASGWSDRLIASHADIKEFSPGHRYDLIISNPPFYGNSYKSKSQQRNTAMHGDRLQLNDLLVHTDRLLSERGVFYLLLPPFEMELFIKNVGNNLTVFRDITVYNDIQKKSQFRQICAFSRVENDIQKVDKLRISIRDGDGNYTEEFINLLKDYYLYL